MNGLSDGMDVRDERGQRDGQRGIEGEGREYWKKTGKQKSKRS